MDLGAEATHGVRPARKRTIAHKKLASGLAPAGPLSGDN
jgi:hypothetical protein